ncbi:tetratricopeptide repeat protein [Longispora sp. NPDC051575]|uniref:tetratricopeptide repeat protein n=1 Tax=Longispora sp. NPDC051575 TaxID=3154943 RepID=UPI00342F9E61
MTVGSPADGPWQVVNTVTGSVVIGAVIQGQTVHVTLPPQVTPATGGLPPVVQVFTGRDAELEALVEGLVPGGAGGTVLVSAVAGMAGVGKTELVLQAAHQALKRPGWFPGGVLFVDLYGYDPQLRLSASDALARWLQAIGVPGEHIPAHEQDRARLWRTVLDAYAGAGRRLLLIIDNAADTNQITPLLPTGSTVPVLVTSRHTLDLDARLHTLPVLATGPAVDLVTGVIRLRCSADDPRAQDPQHRPGLAELAGLCAGLPLALRIVAALLADRRHLTPAALAVSLRDEHRRLDRLRRTETNGEVAVRAAFDLSYRHLAPAQARLFRLLPVNPGPDVATTAATRLAGLTEGDTEVLLQDLHRAHLIEEPAPDRWRQHDLLRLYATEQAPTTSDEAATARQQLTTHYLACVSGADAHLRALPGDAVPVGFSDREDALAWLDAERLNLVATIHHAAATGDHHTASEMSTLLNEYLSFRRHFTDWLTLADLALTAALALGDRHGQGIALNSLGTALLQVRRFDEAIDACQRAADIYHALGDRFGEGIARNSLGIVLREVRRFDEAISACQRAADIYHALGDRHREGSARNNLGSALLQVRRFDEAIDACQQAAGLHSERGDRYGVGQALNNLGLALQEVRRFDEAIDACQRAADIYHEFGDRHGEGAALNSLGIVLREVRRFDEAIDACQRAADILAELGDRHTEGTALNSLGIVLREVRRFDEAIDACQRAADIYHALGDRHGEAGARNSLGIVLREVRRFDEAIDACQRAADIVAELGDRHGEGIALNNLGTALLQAHRLEEGIAVQQQVLAICRTLGDRHGEGIALNNLGIALRQVRRFDKAITACQQAADIHRALDDRHGEAGAHNNLGTALLEVRRFDEAITAHQQAANIFGELGDRHGEGMALGKLGNALLQVRRFDEARNCWQRAQEAFIQAGDNHSAGIVRQWLTMLDHV